MEDRKALIESAKGRFCSATFIKADGSLRRMTVQPAALKFHVKGDDASEAGAKAAKTRKARHPDLFPVWSVHDRAIRSINLHTLTEARVNGVTHTF